MAARLYVAAARRLPDRYQARISGPLLDRILRIDVPALSESELM